MRTIRIRVGDQDSTEQVYDRHYISQDFSAKEGNVFEEAIESLNSQVGKAIKNRRIFPSDHSASITAHATKLACP